MPNPEKETNKANLHNKLEIARQGRLQQGVANDSNGSTGAGGTSTKKVVKKPPRNFGGGVLGKT